MATKKKEEPSIDVKLNHRQNPASTPQDKRRPSQDSNNASNVSEVVMGGGFMLYGDVTDDVDQRIDDMLAAGVASPLGTNYNHCIEKFPGFACLHEAFAECCDTSTCSKTIEIIRIIFLDGDNKRTSTCRRATSSLGLSSRPSADNGSERRVSLNKDNLQCNNSNTHDTDRPLRDSYLGRTLPRDKRVSIQQSVQTLKLLSSPRAAAPVIAENYAIEDSAIDEEENEICCDEIDNKDRRGCNSKTNFLRENFSAKRRAYVQISMRNLKKASSRALVVAEENEEKEEDEQSVWKSTNNSSTELSEEERYDIEKWRTRLMNGFSFSTSVFDKGYIPKHEERLEMVEIADFLGFNMNVYEHEQSTVLSSSLGCSDEATQTAIQSIFFPNHDEQQSVLLKRGPVLVGGEDERELILFTNGFVLARMEMDTLVDLLLDTSTSSRNKEEDEDLVLEKLCERFNDMVTDHGGSLDSGEILDLFESFCIPISTYTLDLLMKRFDSDFDGYIDLSEFKAMLHHGMNQPRHDSEKKIGGLPWLKTALRKKKGRQRRASAEKQMKLRKLDVAYCMSDIDKIIDVGLCYGADVFDPDCAKLTFAVYIKNVEDSLVITCSKSGQVRAWMDALRTCIKGLKSQIPQPEPQCGNHSQSHIELERSMSHNKLLDDGAERVSWGSLIEWEDDIYRA